MPKINLEITDHTAEVLQELGQKMSTVLSAIGQECEGYAKDNCPVDTGNLRNSITYEVNESEKAVYVGTNVEYAVYVEYGDYTHKVGKSHFLRDAAADHADHYESILRAALDS